VLTVEMDFSPDLPAMWTALGFAVAFFTAALGLTLYRRGQGRNAGIVVHVLLFCTAVAAYVAYRAYFPDCPRNWWC
jgi:hypothetical protein